MSCSKMQHSCKECKKKFLRAHGKKPSCSFSPISAVPSFFKIMIGDFGEALFIPPKFARTLGSLVNKNIYLEDSVGNCWMVKLTAVDGSLAFQEGWLKFVSDHSISLGEIVIFNRISTSLFTVQIYGTSGSKRLEFQGNDSSNNHKRKRSKNEISPDIFFLRKAQRSCEASEGKHKAPSKDSSKKYRVERTFPSGLASSKKAARNSVTRGAGEHTYSLEESPPHDDGPGTQHNSLTMYCSEASCKIIDKGKRVEEAGRNSPNSPIVVSDDDDDADTDTVIMTKDDYFPYVDKSKRHLKNSAKVHVKSRKENLAVHSSTSRCLLTSERKSSMVCKEGVIKLTPTSVYPETSQSKKNLKGTKISAVNEGKMLAREKAVGVENNKDKEGDLAACNRSNDRYSVIDKNLVCKQELIEITPITPVRPEQFHRKRSSQDTNKLEVNDEKLSDQHISPKRCKISTDDSSKCETTNQVEDRAPFVTHPFAKERVPVNNQTTNSQIERNNRPKPKTFSNELDGVKFVGQSYERPESATPKCVEDKCGNLIVLKESANKSLVMGEGICYNADEDNKDKVEMSIGALIELCAEDEGGNLIVSNEFARESLVMGEGISDTVDEDSKDKIELIIDHSSGLCAAKGDVNVLDAEKADIIRKSSSLHENSPEIPSSNPLLICLGDDQGNLLPSHEGIIKYNQSEGNLGIHTDPSQATTVKSSPLLMADISISLKDPTTSEGDPFPSGIVPGELPEVYAEKITSCSKGEVVAVVKTEIRDSTDDISLNCAKFRTTVSLISQSWLLLPERLPAGLFKKRCLRSVVLLQDPSMKLWPVLYHESVNFIGFVAGWEDFAKANNLQQGDTCQIESISASEPTFKVQFSNVQNPT